MGCDGGTIPKRKEIVKNKGTKEQSDNNFNLAEKWKMCRLSDMLLRKPVVAGQLGYWFNKEQVIEHILQQKSEQQSRESNDQFEESKLMSIGSLNSMKDVKELKLKDNPAIVNRARTNSDAESAPGMFVCPITGLETNGRYKFYFSWKCGCVVSERAIKEVPNQGKCLICQKSYSDCDLIQLNPETKDELEANGAKSDARKARRQMDRESQKAKTSHFLSSPTQCDKASSSSPSKRLQHEILYKNNNSPHKSSKRHKT